ncbi:MAG: class I SAM-dependent methyltransferase [Gammaproteobacteria bacterium]|nr:class I SAM-dependent methyltransferase [Gammaproteobacteria bacterium]
MKLKLSGKLPENSDQTLLPELINFNYANIVELGCGTAFVTRKLAQAWPTANIIAAEVDETQHNKNLAINDLHNVSFQLAGMETINAEDSSIDAVIMLKSLHHVPGYFLQKGFAEVRRILKPGGRIYISEPVFDGDFNEILRLFNDEEKVRQLAFDATVQAVESGQFKFVSETHFLSKSVFADFSDFEERILNVTHSDFAIDDELYQKIKNKFQEFPDSDGSKVFMNPTRVDLLEKH